MYSKFTPLFLLLFCSYSLIAQFDFGIKGGLTYDSIGSLKNELSTLADLEAKAQTGFQFGVYGQVNFFTFYLRPELQFNQSNSAFADNGTLTLSKLEMPVLVGYRFFPFLSFFAGPSFQYILNRKSNTLNLGALAEKATVGLQIGTRFQLGRVGLSVRFERGFTENEIDLLGNNSIDIVGRVDTRPKQWIISASYALKARNKRNSNNED